MKIEVGQIWRERDNRFERTVEVIEYHDSGLPKNVKIRNVKNGKATWASETRFNGKSGGYELVSEAS